MQWNLRLIDPCRRASAGIHIVISCGNSEVDSPVDGCPDSVVQWGTRTPSKGHAVTRNVYSHVP